MAKPDSRRGLALTERGWRECGNHHVLRLRLRRELLDGLEPDLRDVIPVRLQQVWADAHLRRDIRHRQQVSLTRDLEVRGERDSHEPASFQAAANWASVSWRQRSVG